MPARTYSTDVYLTCPAPTAKAARSASRCASSAASHGSPRQPVSKSCTSWCPDATTGNSKAKPGSSNRSANTRLEPRLPMIEAESRARRIDLADGAIGTWGK